MPLEEGGALTSPSAADLRAWSQVGWAELGFPAPAISDPPADPPVEDLLERIVRRALEYVLDVTGRTLLTVPAAMVETFDEAVQKRTEQLVLQQQADEVEGASDELVASFSAGSYSESRRDLADLATLRMINRWPALNDLLWRLCTEEKRAWWLEYWLSLTTDEVAPALAFVELENEDIGLYDSPYFTGDPYGPWGP